MTNKIILILFSIFPVFVFSQNQILSGYIVNKNTGEKIIGATIYNQTNKKTVSSNSYGYYSIELNKISSDTIFCTFFGYSTDSIIISNDSSKIYVFELELGVNIDNITVVGYQQFLTDPNLGNISMQVEHLKLLPSLGAESDVLKAVQMLPGVQGGTEGSSGLYVRGGNIDQNLILLDNVPLYYVNHLGGYVSTFNSDALNNVNLIKGNMPAKYGGRLSSVLDIKMKEGNMNKFSSNFSVSPVVSKFVIEGPIKKQKSSFLISGRVFYLGEFYNIISTLLFESFSINYNFYDLNIKLNYVINNKNRVFLSFYNGKDSFTPKFITDNKSEKIIFPASWGNILASLRYNKIYTKNLFSNLTLAYTKYSYSNSFNYSDKIANENIEETFNSGVNDIILKHEFSYFINNQIKLTSGIDFINHNFETGNYHSLHIINDTILQDTSYGNSKITSNELNFFVQNEINLFDFININLGCRYSFYFINKKIIKNIEPRILIAIEINNKSSVKLAYTQNAQNVHLLSNGTVGIPVDIWVPATEIVIPQKSDQLAIGYYRSFDEFLFSFEIYKKNMNNLISYKEGVSFFGASQDWQNKIETQGKGEAKGFEIFMQKNQGRLKGWIAYSFSSSNRQFKNINNGIKYPFRFDRRHTFHIVSSYELNEKINFSSTWTYGSGYPFTLATGKYIYFSNNNISEQNPSNIFLYSLKNEYRMRAFHHLDISINFIKNKKRSIRTITLSVYNVYNRQNPFYYYLEKDSQNNWHLYQQSMLSIIPSVSYSLKF